MKSCAPLARLLVVAPLVAAHAAVKIIGLGDLPGGENVSRAFAISADGTTIVGESGSTASAATNEYEAFRWTESTGIVGLGDLAGGNFASAAHAVSADGMVITGHGTVSGSLFKAFRWTPALGLTALPDPVGSPNSYSEGNGVSADGSIIAGYAPPSTLYQAATWTGTNNAVLLGDLPGGSTASVGNAVTPNGKAVVGYGYGAAGKEAMFYSPATGMVGLGYLEPGGTESTALAVSADGSVIVGESKSGAGLTKGFRWTLAEGMTGLGTLPGGTGETHPLAISQDGKIILGTAYFSDTIKAFIWDEAHGMRELKAVLEAQGADFAGRPVPFASGISADGRRIIGYGRNAEGNTEGWLAVILPDPPKVAVLTRKVHASRSGRFKLRGTATDDAGVDRVEYQIPGERKWKRARGADRWSVSSKLNSAKKTRILVRSVDEDGQTSHVAAAIIIP